MPSTNVISSTNGMPSTNVMPSTNGVDPSRESSSPPPSLFAKPLPSQIIKTVHCCCCYLCQAELIIVSIFH